MKGNLSAFGKDPDWLRAELDRQGVAALRDVMLATLNEDGELNVYFKNEGQEGTKRTIFQ